jgi:twinkle protein
VRIVIATDNDAPGDALAEELARRLGRERCWRARWPMSSREHEYAAAAANITTKTSTTTAAAASASAPASPADVWGPPPATAAAAFAAIDAAATAASTTPATEKPAPILNPRWYRKDANEVLIKDGPVALKAFVEAAEPLPIRGLLRFHEYYEDVIKHYYLEFKDGLGVTCGWPSLDPYYK